MVNELSSEKLLSLIESYGWFAPARAVLCRRAMESYGIEAARSSFNDSLLFFPNASYIAGKLMRKADCAFADPSLKESRPYAQEEGNTEPVKPKIILAGADYFSREDYESVKEDSLPELGKIAVVDYSKPFDAQGERVSAEDEYSEIVTETLAQIYTEQGYNAEAESIYRKLILQSPEKSAYFASLIDNLKN